MNPGSLRQASTAVIRKAHGLWREPAVIQHVADDEQFGPRLQRGTDMAQRAGNVADPLQSKPVVRQRVPAQVGDERRDDAHRLLRRMFVSFLAAAPQHQGTISYVRSGTGPTTLVLIPGLGSGGEVWKSVVADLGEDLGRRDFRRDFVDVGDHRRGDDDGAGGGVLVAVRR